jgi:hypothetical protein
MGTNMGSARLPSNLHYTTIGSGSNDGGEGHPVRRCREEGKVNPVGQCSPAQSEMGCSASGKGVKNETSILRNISSTDDASHLTALRKEALRK